MLPRDPRGGPLQVWVVAPELPPAPRANADAHDATEELREFSAAFAVTLSARGAACGKGTTRPCMLVPQNNFIAI